MNASALAGELSTTIEEATRFLASGDTAKAEEMAARLITLCETANRERIVLTPLEIEQIRRLLFGCSDNASKLQQQVESSLQDAGKSHRAMQAYGSG